MCAVIDEPTHSSLVFRSRPARSAPPSPQYILEHERLDGLRGRAHHRSLCTRPLQLIAEGANALNRAGHGTLPLKTEGVDTFAQQGREGGAHNPASVLQEREGADLVHQRFAVCKHEHEEWGDNGGLASPMII